MKSIHSWQFFLIWFFSVTAAAHPTNSSTDDAQSKVEVGRYCECSFNDSTYPSKQTFFVGWLGGREGSKQRPLVTINSKSYTNFIKRYERFNYVVGSYGEFLLIDEKDTIKGKLNTTQNCEIDTGHFCEYIEFKGNAEVTINGITNNYSIIGSCGCI